MCETNMKEFLNLLLIEMIKLCNTDTVSIIVQFNNYLLDYNRNSISINQC